MQDRAAELADRLDELFDGIVGCHVVIEETNKKHRHGNPFRARVDLVVPGRAIVAASEHVERDNAHNAWEALTDAFERAERQLMNYRDALKSHRA